MALVEVAAAGAGALLVVAIAFQASLALGVPLGEATMGGRATTVHGVLTAPYRLMAVASAVLLAVAALIVLARAGGISLGLPESVLVVGAWVVVAFTVVNTLTNLSGRHPLERWGMSALTAVTAVLSGYVALIAPG
jgi:hypothetical protein